MSTTNEDDAALNAWLAPLGCYHDALREHGYDDLLTLRALADDELRQMLDTCGVAKEGHRVLFRRKIADLAAKRLAAAHVPAPAPAPAPAPTPAPVAAPAPAVAATATATANPLLDQPPPPALLPPQTYARAATPPAYGGLPPVTAPPPKPIPVDEEQFRALGERSRQIADQCAQQLVSRAPLYAMPTAFTPAAGLHHVQPVPAQEVAPTLTPSRLSRRHEVPALDAALPLPPPPAARHVSPSRDGVTVDDLRTKRDAVAKYLLALDEQLYATAAHVECEAAAVAAVSASASAIAAPATTPAAPAAPAASLTAAGAAAPAGVRPLANST